MLGSLYHVVHVLRVDEHILEIDIECLSQTSDPHHPPICIRVWMVPDLSITSGDLSISQKNHTSLEERA